MYFFKGVVNIISLMSVGSHGVKAITDHENDPLSFLCPIFSLK